MRSESSGRFRPAFELKSKTIDEIEIPVVYVSGLHEQCDIFANHLTLDSALVKQGYKTINITNSQYAQILDYIFTYSLFNPFEFNPSTDIESIKEQVIKTIHQTNADILIVSNINNFVDSKNYIVNYGFDNYVLNNVFDFDYVIYNIPTNMLISDSQKSMEFLTKAISEKTNNAEVILGVSHAMLDKYFDNNYYFIRVQEDEYLHCFNQYKCLFKNIVDSLSIKDITRYFSKF